MTKLAFVFLALATVAGCSASEPTDQEEKGATESHFTVEDEEFYDGPVNRDEKGDREDYQTPASSNRNSNASRREVEPGAERDWSDWLDE